jgi:integrase
MNISLYIDKSKKDKRGLVPIFAAIRIAGKNFKFPVEKTKERYWNKSKQRINKNREHEPYNRHEEINSYLERLTNDPSRFLRFQNYTSPPLKEDVKRVLLSISPETKSFNEAYEEFIESNRNKVAYNTTKGRKTAQNFINKYQKHHNYQLQFSDISIQFFESLYSFAFEAEDLETNTFVSYVAKFKAFLNWANEKGYYSGNEYKRYTVAEKIKNIVFLTPEEFRLLYNYKFESDRLDRARDLYCFGCLTGLRFSDISSLRDVHVNGDYIGKNIDKTWADDRIPILPQARKILDKYKGNGFYALPRISNQKLNDYIKDCCEIAGIKTPTVKVIYKGNRREEKVLPKYDLITVHTARKTFITLGFINGLDTKIIKSITGHKKDSTFDKYLKVSDDFKKERLFEAWGKI